MFGGQIPNLHVLEHALPKRSHRHSSAHASGPFRAGTAERIEDCRSPHRETEIWGWWGEPRATGSRDAG